MYIAGGKVTLCLTPVIMVNFGELSTLRVESQKNSVSPYVNLYAFLSKLMNARQEIDCVDVTKLFF